MIHLDVQGIIDLIQAKAMSIFTLLDEECRMPKAKGKDSGTQRKTTARAKISPKTTWLVDVKKAELLKPQGNLKDLCVLGVDWTPQSSSDNTIGFLGKGFFFLG